LIGNEFSEQVVRNKRKIIKYFLLIT